MATPLTNELMRILGPLPRVLEMRVARMEESHARLLEACKAMMPEGWGDDDAMDHMPGIKLARLAIAAADELTK